MSQLKEWFEAAMAGDARALLNMKSGLAGKDVPVNAKKETALMLSAQNGHYQACSVLLSTERCRVSASGWSAIHYAAAAGRQRICQLLQPFEGRQLTEKESRGIPAGATYGQVGLQLGQACFAKQCEEEFHWEGFCGVVDWLAGKAESSEEAAIEACKKAPDSLGRTPLHYIACLSPAASMEDRYASLCARMLGGSIAADKAGMTPLMLAAMCGNICFLATRREEDVQARNGADLTAWDLAVQAGHQEAACKYIGPAGSVRLDASAADSLIRTAQSPISVLRGTNGSVSANELAELCALRKENAALQERIEDFRVQTEFQQKQFETLREELGKARFMGLQAVQSLLRSGVQADLTGQQIVFDRAGEFGPEKLERIFAELNLHPEKDDVETVGTITKAADEAFHSGDCVQLLYDLIQTAQAEWVARLAASRAHDTEGAKKLSEAETLLQRTRDDLAKVEETSKAQAEEIARLTAAGAEAEEQARITTSQLLTLQESAEQAAKVASERIQSLEDDVRSQEASAAAAQRTIDELNAQLAQKKALASDTMQILSQVFNGMQAVGERLEGIADLQTCNENAPQGQEEEQYENEGKEPERKDHSGDAV